MGPVKFIIEWWFIISFFNNKNIFVVIFSFLLHLPLSYVIFLVHSHKFDSSRYLTRQCNGFVLSFSFCLNHPHYLPEKLENFFYCSNTRLTDPTTWWSCWSYWFQEILRYVMILFAMLIWTYLYFTNIHNSALQISSCQSEYSIDVKWRSFKYIQMPESHSRDFNSFGLEYGPRFGIF